MALFHKRMSVPRLMIILHSITNQKYLLYNFRNETPNFCQKQNETTSDVGNVGSVSCGVAGQRIIVPEQLKSELYDCNSAVTVHFSCCQ